MAAKAGATSAATDTKKKLANAVADGLNWEQRIRVEVDAPKKWNESWGSNFSGDVPFDYEERIKYFEAQLKSSTAKDRVQYGPEYISAIKAMEPDFRRRKVAEFV